MKCPVCGRQSWKGSYGDDRVTYRHSGFGAPTTCTVLIDLDRDCHVDCREEKPHVRCGYTTGNGGRVWLT